MKKDPILVPIKIAGRVTGFDAKRNEAQRETDVVIRFDIANASTPFGRFVNALGKDKVAPAYNLLLALVTEGDSEAMQARLQDDNTAIMATIGELTDILIPDVERTIKN